ncbi:MAG: cyclodeaminase/cyclohydrolase family protein, partial [Candidatus Omnitrophota bacterium]
KSIRRYMEELAARQPAPGGGSAAGLVGATGAALLEMVCNFTLGNERYKNHHNDIQGHLKTLKRIREIFLVIIDDDVKIYSAIHDAFKAKKKKDIEKALRNGYYVSDKACRLSKDAMEIAMDLAVKGNVNLITDVGCGAELLESAFNSAVFNCRINLKGMDDNFFVEKESMNVDSIKKEIEALYKKIIAKVKERMK